MSTAYVRVDSADMVVLLVHVCVRFQRRDDAAVWHGHCVRVGYIACVVYFHSCGTTSRRNAMSMVLWRYLGMADSSPQRLAVSTALPFASLLCTRVFSSERV